jgi:hypothetical protein
VKFEPALTGRPDVQLDVVTVADGRVGAVIVLTMVVALSKVG